MYHIDKEKLVWRQVDDEMIILNLEEASYYILNQVACTIWENLCEGKAIQEIADKVFQTFLVDFQTALHDTQEYFEILCANKLVTRSENIKDG